MKIFAVLVVAFLIVSCGENVPDSAKTYNELTPDEKLGLAGIYRVTQINSKWLSEEGVSYFVILPRSSNFSDKYEIDLVELFLNNTGKVVFAGGTFNPNSIDISENEIQVYKKSDGSNKLFVSLQRMTGDEKDLKDSIQRAGTLAKETVNLIRLLEEKEIRVSFPNLDSDHPLSYSSNQIELVRQLVINKEIVLGYFEKKGIDTVFLWNGNAWYRNDKREVYVRYDTLEIPSHFSVPITTILEQMRNNDPSL